MLLCGIEWPTEKPGVFGKNAFVGNENKPKILRKQNVKECLEIFKFEAFYRHFAFKFNLI